MTGAGIITNRFRPSPKLSETSYSLALELNSLTIINPPMPKTVKTSSIIGFIAVVLLIEILLLRYYFVRSNLIYLLIPAFILGGLVGILLDRFIVWSLDRYFNRMKASSIEKPMKPNLVKTIRTVPIEPPSNAKVNTEHYDDKNIR